MNEDKKNSDLHCEEAWNTDALRYQCEMNFKDRSSGMQEHVI
jgi:hypothetical protein